MRHVNRGSHFVNPFRISKLGLGQNDHIIRKAKVIGWTLLVLIALGALASSSGGRSSIWSISATSFLSRTIASSQFPQVKAVSDESEILAVYPEYLKFVLEVGQQTDSQHAKRLADTYQTLRAKYPASAARFLKGLRFEMVEKVELMGANPANLNSHSPEMRRWVAKFMKDWAREADENLFRAVTAQKALARR